MPSEQLTKLINLANRAIDSSVREVNILKQELEADFSDRQNKSMSSTEDLNAMIAAITLGKGLISFSQ